MDLKQLSESRQSRIVDAVKRKIKSQPPVVAQHLGIPSSMVPMSSVAERRAYWTPDPEVMMNPQQFYEEVASAALGSAAPDEDPQITLQRAKHMFALRLYPARAELIKSGGRGLSVKEQIDFADLMEKQGPPTDTD